MFKKIIYVLFIFISVNLFVSTLTHKKAYAASWITFNNTVAYYLEGATDNNVTYDMGLTVGLQPLNFLAFTVDGSTTITNNDWRVTRFSFNIISVGKINPNTLDYYPYIGIGFGVVYGQESVTVNNSYERFNASGIGFNMPVMAGIHFSLQRVMLTIDIRYVYSTAELNHKYSKASYERDYGGFTGSIGIGYIF